MATATSADRGLHDRLEDRDIAALAEVYDQFGSTVFATALRVTRDRHAAKDVTQEVLLALWRRPDRYDPDRGGLRSWLAAVAHNRSVDWVCRRQTARTRESIDLDRALAEPVPDVGGTVEATMTADRIRAAVSALPEPQRTAIELAYFSGRSYRQVAEDLAVPEGTIKTRIRSGLRHLSVTMYADAPVEL